MAYISNLQSLQSSMTSTYSANFIKITNTVQQIQQFKLESSFFSSEHAVASWLFSKSYLITNQTLHNFIVNTLNASVMNVSRMPSRYLNWVFKVSASCSKTKSSLFLNHRVALWTPVANHSILKQGSLQLGNVGWFWRIWRPIVLHLKW